MLSFYFTTLTKSISQPRHLFSQLPQEPGVKKPLGYLLISSIFFSAAAAITTMAGNPVICAGLHLINAIGMTLIAAGLGYMMIFVIKRGRQVTFQQVLSIYAISSGTTLLAAWIPYFLVFTEPWKWWLIGTGITKTCRLSILQALWVIVLSLGVIVCAFGLVLPMTLPNAG